MFQARYFLLFYLFTTLIFCNFSFAEVIKTKEEERANYVITNMQNDYIICYIFYKIGAESIRRSDGETDIVKGIEESADVSLKFAYETGELMGMKSEIMSTKVQLEMKKQSEYMQNDYNNAPKLLKKYGLLCKNLIQDKKERIDFWEKKALTKFK